MENFVQKNKYLTKEMMKQKMDFLYSSLNEIDKSILWNKLITMKKQSAILKTLHAMQKRIDGVKNEVCIDFKSYFHKVGSKVRILGQGAAVQRTPIDKITWNLHVGSFCGVLLSFAVLKRIFILGQIEYQILFVWWKLNKSNMEYYLLIKKIFKYISNTWNIQKIEYIHINLQKM